MINETHLILKNKDFRLSGFKRVMAYYGGDIDGLVDLLLPLDPLYQLYYMFRYSKPAKFYIDVYYNLGLKEEFDEQIEHYGLFTIQKYNKKYDAHYVTILVDNVEKSGLLLMA